MDHTPTIRYGVFPSPLGALTLTLEGECLSRILFDDHPLARERPPSWVRDEGALDRVATELGEYFGGRRQTFDLPLAMRGTPFQLRVWELLSEVPFGAVESYGFIAHKLDARGASRAVGAANGKNPIPIVVPCHRIIGASGALTGYGGGMWRKRWLLSHEGVLERSWFDAPSRGSTLERQ